MADMFDTTHAGDASPSDTRGSLLRVARTAEAGLLSRFMARTFLDSHGMGGNPAPILGHIRSRFNAAVQSGELGDPNQAILVAGDPGDYLAYAQLCFATAPVKEVQAARPCELSRFFVDRPHWGTGLSTRLMQQASSHASQRGCDAIWTLAWQQAPRAFRFLRREGFDVAGSMTSMIGDETREEWVMVRRLD